jgi:Protein of unknown function (DUF3551)
MTPISKLTTASAAALCAAVFVSFAAPAAQAGEYCSTNSSGMRGCGYVSLEQCQAATSGLMGTCSRDPYYKDPKDALALQAKRPHGAAKQAAQR